MALPHPLTEIPIRIHRYSTETQIKVEIAAVETGIKSGGIPITSYSIEWNGGGESENNWTSIIGEDSDSLNTEFITTNLLTGTM